MNMDMNHRVGESSTDDGLDEDVASVAIPESAETLAMEFESWPEPAQLEFLGRLFKLMSNRSLSEAMMRLNALSHRDFFCMLPQDLSEKILRYLCAEDLCQVSRVNRVCYRLVNDNDLWVYHFNKMLKRDEEWKSISHLMQAYPNSFSSGKDAYQQYHRKILSLNANWKRGKCDKDVIQCDGFGCYCFQYDNEKIVAGIRDNTIKVWSSVRPHSMIRRFFGHQGSVLCLQYDNDKIISGSSDSTIRVWDINTTECLYVLTDHLKPVLQVKFNTKNLITSSKDDTIIIWNIVPNPTAGKPPTFVNANILRGHQAAVNTIDFNNDYVVSGSGDRTIRVWNISDGSVKQILATHTRGIACVQIYKEFIASGSSDSNVFIWSLETGACIRQLIGHSDLVRCLRFKEKYLISGSYDKTIRVWNWKTGEEVLRLLGHESRVFRVDFDAAKIISSSQDDTIRIWNFDIDV